MDPITPVAIVEATAATRRALQGARARDPVRPDARERRPRLRRAAAAAKRGFARAPRPAPARAH
jgi:hypothetical protein